MKPTGFLFIYGFAVVLLCSVQICKGMFSNSAVATQKQPGFIATQTTNMRVPRSQTLWFCCCYLKLHCSFYLTLLSCVVLLYQTYFSVRHLVESLIVTRNLKLDIRRTLQVIIIGNNSSLIYTPWYWTFFVLFYIYPI